eukprot:1028941-Amphidinium_carterae.1
METQNHSMTTRDREGTALEGRITISWVSFADSFACSCCHVMLCGSYQASKDEYRKERLHKILVPDMPDCHRLGDRSLRFKRFGR